MGGGGLLIRVCLGFRCCVPGATRLSRAAGVIRRAAAQWSAPPSAPHGGRGGGPDEFGGFAAVESGGGGAAKKEASEGKEGGGDGWGDGDGWDDDFDASPAYPTLTAYDRNGVKVASPARFSPTIFAGWWHCWPGAGRRGRTQPRCCEILAGSMLPIQVRRGTMKVMLVLLSFLYHSPNTVRRGTGAGYTLLASRTDRGDGLDYGFAKRSRHDLRQLAASADKGCTGGRCY